MVEYIINQTTVTDGIGLSCDDTFDSFQQDALYTIMTSQRMIPPGHLTLLISYGFKYPAVSTATLELKMAELRKISFCTVVFCDFEHMITDRCRSHRPDFSQKTCSYCSDLCMSLK